MRILAVVWLVALAHAGEAHAYSAGVFCGDGTKDAASGRRTQGKICQVHLSGAPSERLDWLRLRAAAGYQSDDNFLDGEMAFVGTLAPVAFLEAHKFYLELQPAGVAFVSKKHPPEIGTHWQVETRFVAGIKPSEKVWGGLGVVHYSNAGTGPEGENVGRTYLTFELTFLNW